MRGLTLVVILLTPLAAAAQAPDPADLELAKAHYKTGELYYERGRFPDAAREFEEAYRLSKKPELLFNMGKSYDGVGDYAKALVAYRRWMAEVPNGSDRGQVESRVRAMEGLVGKLLIEPDVEGSSVLVDGLERGPSPLAGPIEVNPGAHNIVVAHEGYKTFRKNLVASPGRLDQLKVAQESLVKVVKQVVEVERKEKQVPVYKKWWLWTAIGAVVAAGVVTGAVLGSQQPPVSGDFAQLPGVK
jgi:tetratricopeptide (TPR) repeat protein